MPKVTNITPEEREQAISTIGKLGEEITDERIEYYVQLRRNTIRHQEEKLTNKRKNNVTNPLDEKGRKKYTRICKLMALVSVLAVVMTFITSGFSFSIGWYLIIILLLVLALVFYIEGSDSSQALNDGDSLIINIATVVSLCFVALLWLWGPLNSNYERSGGRSSSSFSSSEDSGDVRYYNGEKLRKKYLKCAECGDSMWYWQSESSSLSLNKPNTWHGNYYCSSCYSYKKDMEDVAKKAARKFQGI